MVDYHGRFVWYELITTDIKAAQAFYTKVVGWGTLDVSMPGMAYSLFTVGEASISGQGCKPLGARNELQRNPRRSDLLEGALSRRLVGTEADELSPMAKAIIGDVVITHLDH